MLLWTVLLVSASYVGGASAASIGTAPNTMDAIAKIGKLFIQLIQSRIEKIIVR